MRKMVFIFLLVLLEGIIFATNYSHNTYLIGWDNIMPELNLSLNLKRSIFSVWQEYRGLGTLDGLAHAANLAHTLTISALSLLAPQNMLRYIYIYGTHLAGGIGMFFLITTLIPKHSNTEENANVNNLSTRTKLKQLFTKNSLRLTPSNTIAFLASLLYMFSIGIIQMYYAPLEVFATHFAALPILTYLTILAIKHCTAPRLLLLGLSSFLLSSQGFVPTVFAPFALVICSILAFNFKKHPKKIFLIALIFIASNAHWAFPYSYSAINTPQVIQNARINEFSSEEIFYRNQARGDIASTLAGHGFMLDTIEYDTEKGENIFFMQKWRDHLSTPLSITISTSIVLLTLAGVLLSFLRRKKEILMFLPPFTVALFFLENNTPVVRELNQLLRALVPQVAEAYRIPFTKFETVFLFTATIFFAFTLLNIYSYLKTHLKAVRKTIVIAPTAILLTAFLLYNAYPAFQGHFTSPLLRNKIPQEYFDSFEFFQTKDPNARIAQFPMYTFWNWEYRTWQHRGSGFAWYAIPQPILTRAFDPWSIENEQFYNEIAQALKNSDPQQLNNVLTKYNVRYLLVDEYVLNTLAYNPINYQKLKDQLTDTNWSQVKDFGKISIFENTNIPSWITSATDLPEVASSHQTSHIDIIYSSLGNYQQGKKSPHIQLFPSFTTEKKKENREVQFTWQNDKVTLKPKNTTPIKIESSYLLVPSIFATEFFIPVTVTHENNSLVLTPQYPTVQLNDRTVNIQVSPITIPTGPLSDNALLTFTDTGHNLNLSEQNSTYLISDFLNTIHIEDNGKSATVYVDTQEQSKEPIYIELQDEVITQVQAEVPIIQAPPGLNTQIQNTDYTHADKKNDIHPYKKVAKSSITQTSTGLEMKATATSSEVSFFDEDLPHSASYVIQIESDHTKGLPINFYIDNPFENRAETETLLDPISGQDTLVLPPTQDALAGYGFHFTVKSVGEEEAIATIDSIQLYPFPYHLLNNLRITPNSPNESQTKNTSFTHTQPALYVVDNASDTTLLSQSYDKGWVAYIVKNAGLKEKIAPFIFGKKVQNHTKVNNWQSGWNISNDCTGQNCKMLIVYLPQYLQYIGLFFVIASLTTLLILTLKKRI